MPFGGERERGGKKKKEREKENLSSNCICKNGEEN